MEMSNREIVHRYCTLGTPINILAELNAVEPCTIKKVLEDEGVDIAKRKRRNITVIEKPKRVKAESTNATEEPKKRSYTKSGKYTKEAKTARAVERINKKKAKENTKEEDEPMATAPTKKTTQAAVPEMSESVKKLIFSRLDELEVKMSYHKEQIKEYEREYEELCEQIGIKRKYSI